MVTDKQKYAALAYYYVRQRIEEEPRFAVTGAFGCNAILFLRGAKFPSPAEEDLLVREFPKLKGLLKRHSPQKVELSNRGVTMFDALAHTGNAHLYIRSGKSRLLKGADGSPVPKTQSKGSALSLGVELGVLAQRCSNSKRWLAMLEAADRSGADLPLIVEALRNATSEVTHA